jgi:hypothetical protein
MAVASDRPDCVTCGTRLTGPLNVAYCDVCSLEVAVSVAELDLDAILVDVLRSMCIHACRARRHIAPLVAEVRRLRAQVNAGRAHRETQEGLPKGVLPREPI